MSQTKIATYIAFNHLSEEEFSDAIALARVPLNRRANVRSRKQGLPRTALNVCDQEHIDEIHKLVETHGISADRMMLLVYMAMDNVDEEKLPDVAVAAIKRFGMTDVRVSVVPAYDDE